MKIDKHDLKPIPLGNSAILKKGDKLISLAIDGEGKHILLDGELLEEMKLYKATLIRHNIPGSSGSSGTPIFNTQGKIVGIYTRGCKETKN